MLMGPQFFAALVVTIEASQLVTAVGPEGTSFGDRLFAASLPHAKKSLQGQFISEMVAGTLPAKTFQEFLFQDNLYLSKYARAFAVLGARATRTDELQWLLNQSVNYLHEHGPGANDALDDKEYDKEAANVTKAYASFFLDKAWGKNQVLGYSSVVPCQRLYDWLFSTIKATRHIANDNPYKALIDFYADPVNHRTTKVLEGYLERYVRAHDSSGDIAEEAQRVYNRAMQYEAEFFAQALALDHDKSADKLGAGKILLTPETLFSPTSSRKPSLKRSSPRQLASPHAHQGSQSSWLLSFASAPDFAFAATAWLAGMCLTLILWSRWARPAVASGSVHLLSA